MFSIRSVCVCILLHILSAFFVSGVGVEQHEPEKLAWNTDSPSRYYCGASTNSYICSSTNTT